MTILREHTWFMELKDGTKFPFWWDYDDGVTNPLTSISGFDRGNHYLIEAALHEMGPSGSRTIPPGLLFHPLASGVDIDASGLPGRPFSPMGREFTEDFPGRGRPDFPGRPFDPPGQQKKPGRPFDPPGQQRNTTAGSGIPPMYLIKKSDVVKVYSGRTL